MKNASIEMSGITKAFSGIQVLSDINLQVNQGEILVIVGENGAGKSTLVKILAGLCKVDSGAIAINGTAVNITSPGSAEKLGIGVIHQECTLVPTLNACENIFLCKEYEASRLPFMHCLDTKKMNRYVRELAANFDIQIDFDREVRFLNIVQHRYIQILRALISNPQIIIFDEVTSILSSQDSKKIIRMIKKLKSEGKTVIYLSCRFDELDNFGDRVVILKDGQIIPVTSENTNESNIIEMVFGLKETRYPKLPVRAGKSILSVEHLTDHYFKDISFELREGEIIGITGVARTGCLNIVKSILGIEKLSNGNIFLDGKKVYIKSVYDAIRNGIVYISDNQDVSDLFLKLGVSHNITVSNLASVSKHSCIIKKHEKNAVQQYLDALSVHITDPDQKTVFLSGGNRQKVAIARCLFSKARIFIFNEPTANVDASGKIELYNIMNELTLNRAAIIMVSSDFSELIGMCNRILIIKNQSIANELVFDSATKLDLAKSIYS